MLYGSPEQVLPNHQAATIVHEQRSEESVAVQTSKRKVSKPPP